MVSSGRPIGSWFQNHQPAGQLCIDICQVVGLDDAPLSQLCELTANPGKKHGSPANARRQPVLPICSAKVVDVQQGNPDSPACGQEDYIDALLEVLGATVLEILVLASSLGRAGFR